jgi:hypothetical protein
MLILTCTVHKAAKWKQERNETCTCVLHFLKFFLLMWWDWIHLVLRPLFRLLYQPQMMMMMMMIVEQRVECELAGETEVLGEYLPQMPLCSPQIRHDLPRARTQAAAVRSSRLTAWAMARPLFKL